MHSCLSDLKSCWVMLWKDCTGHKARRLIVRVRVCVGVWVCACAYA